jgi:RND family efflux transporter MFP subunit
VRLRPIDYATALAASALFATAGCGPPAPAPAVVAAPALEVEYVTVRPQRSTSIVELPGVVVPERSATLTAPMGGQIRTLAEEGARVATNAQVALLATPGLPEQLSAARAAVDAAERRRSGAETAVRQASTELDESVSVLEQTLKAVEAERNRRKELLAEAELQAEAEPERLRAQAQAAEARVRLLKSGERPQRIRQLQASLDVARAEAKVAAVQLQRTRSLFGQGYVSKRDVETAELTLQRARASELQHVEEVRLQSEGAHPEAIAEAEQQAEAARQALKNAGGLKLQVSQRRAELAGADADVAKAVQNLSHARTNHLAITRARDEAAATGADARRSSMEMAEAKERLAQSTVRAPFAGQVVQRRARPGETVVAGAPLLEVVDAGRLAFEATVTDADIARVRLGAAVPVVVASVSPRPLPGRVREIIGTSDPVKRTYRVKIELLSAAQLRPGMIGVARLPSPGASPGLRLPVAALRHHVPSEHRGEVWVLEGDHPVIREVQLGTQGATHVVIASGVRSGERVVVSDPAAVDLSRPVRAREVTSP